MNMILRSPRKQPIDGFVYLAISDPQTIDERQMKRFREETVPDLKQTIEHYRRKRGLRYGAGRHYLGSHGFIHSL